MKKVRSDIIKLTVTRKGKKTPSPPEVFFDLYPYGIRSGRPERFDWTGPVQDIKKEDFAKDLGLKIIKGSEILSKWFEKK